MNVCYQGPLLDYSGYGEANRHFVAALEAADVHVIGKLLAYSKERADYGTLGPIITRALENKAHYKIQILHTTPDEFERLLELGKYHIAHFFWETDKLPDVFVKGLNLVDEIWTGSNANKEAMLKSGVRKPIFIFPQPIETDRDWPAPYELPGFPAESYLFYSIFEWTDRKNPQALIRAYYDEFTNGENVGLLIKSYFRSFTLNNKRMIRDSIDHIKTSMGVDNLPPIFLYLDLMDRMQIMRLHMTGDCYVSAHRGEGWGVPQVEAALSSHPVISTGYGGSHEYFLDNNNGIMLPYAMTPLRGMGHSDFYNSDQKWAEVDPLALRKAMRWAYENQKAAKEMGAKAKIMVDNTFNLKRVGDMMAKRLQEIEVSHE